MVGSFSDAWEEVYIAKETIRKWNQINAERTGKLFMPVEWTTKTEGIQNVDVVTGVIGNWIENEGFIERCIEHGKQVMLFFNTNQDPTNTIMSEQNEVVRFHTIMKEHCYCANFSKASELSLTLSERLDIIDDNRSDMVISK